MIEGHGDDLYRYGDRIKHNFSTNIISGVDHSALKEFLKGELDKIGSYPEPAPFSLERRIAEKIGVGTENVVVTNGATDAMYRIAGINRGRRSAIVVPTFREYQDACATCSHEIYFVKEDEKIPFETDLVWICNPNNPTGRGVARVDILSLAHEREDRVVVVDQAYADYAMSEVLSPEEAVEAGNIILLSSLTKRYAVPGLRIGYMVAARDLAMAIRKAGIPWSVNALAIEAGKYLIEHDGNYPIPLESLHNEALRLSDAFGRMGIECRPTDCNFILCRLPEGEASCLKEFLVENYGILIRDASNFEGLDSRYFRVAAQTAQENDLLINGVKEWLKNQN